MSGLRWGAERVRLVLRDTRNEFRLSRVGQNADTDDSGSDLWELRISRMGADQEPQLTEEPRAIDVSHGFGVIATKDSSNSDP